LKILKLASVIIFSCLIVLSIVELLPLNYAQQQQQQQQQETVHSWVFAGAFLNYTMNGNLGATFTLTNGSSLSFGLNLSGSEKILVDSISGDQANVTRTPNMMLSEKVTYFNGTSKTHAFSLTPANASTSTVPLRRLNFGNVLEQALNQTSSTLFFSPKLNVTFSRSPAEFYQLKSGAKVAVLHLGASLTEKSSIPSQSGTSGSFSLNGTNDLYITLGQGIPLKEALSLKGSGTIQNAGQVLANSQGGSANGNFDFTITLTDTNIGLSSGGNAEQTVIQIPNYSTQLDVVSNSTINSAGTSSNHLIVNVTGPSGTTGVLNVVVSPQILANAGITNASQVGVTVDGQSYSNYTVNDIGGGYVFIIYYHHSSHGIVFSFGNADLGSNSGTISSISPSSSISTTLLIEIGGAAAVLVVVVLAIGIVRRRGGSSGGDPVQP
jgi:hypothetical protein